ncbi:MAG: hypothetical protein NC305_14705 [Lachnospiraceae bacterium]|nr:hypothetical protein [Muribaculaceae bacterium]MCM1411778.1 hypothetical protein [Lachnospiraceae bacterium]
MKILWLILRNRYRQSGCFWRRGCLYGSMIDISGGRWIKSAGVLAGCKTCRHKPGKLLSGQRRMVCGAWCSIRREWDKTE